MNSIHDQHEHFWISNLSGELPTLALPLDFERPPTSFFVRERESILVDSQLSKKVGSFASAGDVSTSTVLFAAFEALLFRFTGQQEMLIGYVVTPQSDAGPSELNPDSNLVPLRTCIEDDLETTEWIRRIAKTIDQATEHACIPFESMLDLAQANSAVSTDLLFRVAFVPPGLSAELDDESNIDERLAQCDVVLTATWEDDGLLLSCDFDGELFCPETISRLLDSFRILLDRMVSDGSSNLSQLPLLSAEQREQLLEVFNDTHVPFVSDVCLHELFEAQVARTPDTIAVVFEAEELTYRELNARANQLAHYLRTLHVRRDVPVGVCMERSLEMVIALYGILKAGGAYVPLDPEYPAERLSFMLDDAQVPVILTHSNQNLSFKMPACTANVICVDSIWESISSESTENPAVDAKDEDLAYVIYTSGSTGNPKGVMNTHRGICNRLQWMQDEYELTPQDRVLQKTPYSFDVSVWEFFWPLLFGARLVVARPGGHRDSGYLVRTINDAEITTIHFVPSMLSLFLDEPDVSTCSTLRQVICSGEALSPEIVHRFFDRLDSQLHNLYGPTEAAVDVTSWCCQRDDQRSIVPIGRPISNTQAYILDRYMRPVPIGVAGELYIGGVQVARGYLNNRELTEEKFIRDHIGNRPGGRLYKTGDLARYLPDGNIEFLGRMDYQVKVRGFRIELGEIESVLERHPDVRQALVMAYDDPSLTAQLAAYFIPSASDGSAPAEVPGTETLRVFLGRSLPEYMIPASFTVLESFPLLPSGKINRCALRPPKMERSKATPLEVPRTGLEETIVGFWQEALKLDEVGVEDNFFELGGHSLMLAQVHSKLRDSNFPSLELVDLYSYPTVRSLAAFLLDQQNGGKLDAAQDRARKQLAAIKRRSHRQPAKPKGLR